MRCGHRFHTICLDNCESIVIKNDDSDSNEIYHFKCPICRKVYWTANDNYSNKFFTRITQYYFKQILSAFIECHKMDIIHGQLKPNYLLIDSKYNIKIYGFGLPISKNNININNKKKIKGLQYCFYAPELITNNNNNNNSNNNSDNNNDNNSQNISKKCDVFSLGVLLFYMLNGYPPFEIANINDTWYKNIIKNKINSFWKKHKNCKIKYDINCKNLISKMLEFDVNKRCNLDYILKHEWFIKQSKSLQINTQKQKMEYLMKEYNKQEISRKNDIKKCDKVLELQRYNSYMINMEFLNKLELYTYNENEECNIYYTFGNRLYFKNCYYTIMNIIGIDLGGKTRIDPFDGSLICELNIKGVGLMSFSIKIYLSSKWTQKKRMGFQTLFEDEMVYVINMKRKCGNIFKFIQFKNEYLLKRWYFLVMGLPKWATFIPIKSKKNYKTNVT